MGVGICDSFKVLLALNECTDEEIEFLETEAEQNNNSLNLALGKYYVNKGNLEKAKLFGEKALLGSNDGVYNLLGSIEQKLRNSEKAMEYYNLGIDKGDISCKYSKGWLAFLLRDYKLAKEVYLELKESKNQGGE